MWGRVTSLVIAVVGLVLFAPLMLLIAVAIRLDSRGPVFFIQERLGLHDRRFNLIKFRTMRVVVGPTSEWVHDNHERITRLGGVLRKFRLDELPQFINVIRGDMNLLDLAGPSPFRNEPQPHLAMVVLVTLVIGLLISVIAAWISALL